MANTFMGNAGCHIINFGELLQQLDVEFGNNETKKIAVPMEKLLTLAGIVWGKLQESFQECEGKELSIELGDSLAANTAEQVLQMVLNFLPEAKQPE